MDMDKAKKHKSITNELQTIYINKNRDYGDSFSNMFNKLGIITALTRIGDKYYRLENIIATNKTYVKEESVKDTLKDLANYCIMTLIELEKEDKS